MRKKFLFSGFQYTFDEAENRAAATGCLPVHYLKYFLNEEA